MKEIFFLDFDGCIAKQQKVWYDFGVKLQVCKLISDHDSWLINKLKDKVDIIIISADDRINKDWADGKMVPFIFAGYHSDKWECLKSYWNKMYKGKPERNYFYLGDSMPDYTCMVNSKMAFYPKDASLILKKNVKELGHVVELGTNSGEGVFEDMIDTLMEAELVSGDLV